jgi:hypothetical protein
MNQPTDKSTVVKLTPTPIIIIVLLITITLGIYYPIWFLQRRSQLNSLHTTIKLGTKPFIFSIIIGILSLVLSFSGRYFRGLTPTQPEMASLAKMLTYSSWAVLLIYLNVLLLQCFKVKMMLEAHFNGYLQRNVAFSGVYTFFLTIYYLQYKINRLE